MASIVKRLVREEYTTIDDTSKRMAKMFEDLDIELEKGPDGRMRPRENKEDKSKRSGGGRFPGEGGQTVNIDNSSVTVNKVVINNGDANGLPSDYKKICEENE